MAKVAINGMGRIGRATLKIILSDSNLELVAINDLIPVDDMVYLLRYDSVYGRYDKQVNNVNGNIDIDGHTIRYLSERNPGDLPWKDLGVDIVFECSGFFLTREQLQLHLNAGAKRAIVSAPAKGDIPTVVHGVNKADDSETIISTASCTTNCITPVVEIMMRRIGVKKAIMTTVHAYTSTQALVDVHHKDVRRGRAAAINFVPASTGAAVATTKVLTELDGKFGGLAIRGPVPAGSISDITMVMTRDTSVEELNTIFKEEAETERYRGIFGFSEEELVSSDILKDTRGSIVDGTSTQVVDGDLVKVLSWYDNEWSYTSQMVREGVRIAGLL